MRPLLGKGLGMDGGTMRTLIESAKLALICSAVYLLVWLVSA